MVTRYAFLAFCALVVGVAGCESSIDATSTAPFSSPSTLPSQGLDKQAIAGQYIVVLNSGVAASSVPSIARELAAASGGRVTRVYQRAIRGFALNATAAGAAAIAADARIARIDQDVRIEVRPAPGTISGRNKAQVVPWGITRVGGAHDATGRRAWIIDSGIDFDQPDLRVGTSLAATFVPGTNDANDQNGHGTHVAGIVGALDNAIGTVGVAAGATVIPVRVLDRRGSGDASWIIAGIDYVLANASPGDVANMSFGGGLLPSLDEAVVRLADAGVRIAIAAGNDGANCSFVSPARVNHANVYTVSAVDASDVFASFSNYGYGIVDFAAPGVDVLSSRKGGGTISMSGTSMAAPHVAGLLVAGSLRTDGRVAIGDNDGQPDPIAIY
jgi:subtilisin family serine protease